jgi:hypothetical protein
MRSRFSTVRFWPFGRDQLLIRCGIPGWHDSRIVAVRGLFLIFDYGISINLTSAVITI